MKSTRASYAESADIVGFLGLRSYLPGQTKTVHRELQQLAITTVPAAVCGISSWPVPFHYVYAKLVIACEVSLTRFYCSVISWATVSH